MLTKTEAKKCGVQSQDQGKLVANKDQQKRSRKATPSLQILIPPPQTNEISPEQLSAFNN
jgi:hypothetical protein